ncbi:hypothetical protein GCM10023187_42780 [Nibrella viscosa]|uniref:Uncharacterized protein n=1 Tax=Nibrella viscosa TaxID=1084524 RepID=A0ABP8KSN8_9BACT
MQGSLKKAYSGYCRQLSTWDPWLDDFNPDLFPVNGQAGNRNMGGMRAIAGGHYDAYH